MSTFPALYDAMKDEQKDEENFGDHAAEAFQNHILLDAPQSKTWFVGKPKDWTYGFRVVWLPGNLHVNGDLGEMSLTHYHAMPTWKEAVDWVDMSDFHYLMGKSDAKEEFNQKATAMEMVRMAEEYYESCDEPAFWKKIFEYLDGFQVNINGTSVFFDPEIHEIDNPENRKIAAKILIEDAVTDLTPETVYHTFEIPDFAGIHKYGYSAKWHYAALKLWVKLVKDSEEYKELEKEEHVQAVP